MDTIKILDLYCKAGGCAVGYDRAAKSLGVQAEITGIDIERQKRYPFRFIQADALTYLAEHGREYDFIHASPECKGYTQARNIHKGVIHHRYIPDVRLALIANGKPYVIENVFSAKADLILDRCIMLCGIMFDLKVFRHRFFELPDGYFPLTPPHEPHAGRRIGKDGFCCVAGKGDLNRRRVPNELATVGAWRRAMGIDWMTRDEISQAIPPAYTEYIGRYMFKLMLDGILI